MASAPSVADELHEFATRLRAAREAQNVSRVAVARAIDVTTAAVAGWERERDWPSAGKFILWTESLGLRACVTGDRGIRLVPARPVPARSDEEPHHYRLRCLVLTLRER